MHFKRPLGAVGSPWPKETFPPSERGMSPDILPCPIFVKGKKKICRAKERKKILWGEETTKVDSNFSFSLPRKAQNKNFLEKEAKTNNNKTPQCLLTWLVGLREEKRSPEVLRAKKSNPLLFIWRISQNVYIMNCMSCMSVFLSNSRVNCSY